MGRFSFCLPPFAPDYSGVCATLFSLGGLTVIHDAAGCTGNYVGYDEPRWYGSRTMLYCSGLRELDAVLGNDDKLIQNVAEAANRMRPTVIAVVGSPVPTIIGTDLKGIAAQIEAETGIPAFGFPTTGMKLYTAGSVLCGKALVDRFARRRTPAPRVSGEPLRVILCGDTPLDFGTETVMEELKRFLTEHGFALQASLWDGASLEEVKHLGEAHLTVAVSASGALLAEHMEKRLGIPYITGFPVGKYSQSSWLEAARETVRSGRSRSWGTAEQMCGPADGTLFLGDQIVGNSLRSEIFHKTGKRLCLGLPFDVHTSSLGAGDVQLKSEARIDEFLNRPEFSCIVGDPLYEGLLEKKDGTCFLALPHYAVSSKIGTKLSGAVRENRIRKISERFV